MVAATGSFYSARGMGSQALEGVAVDEERWAGKTKFSICDSYHTCGRRTLFFNKWFGIEMVLCDLYFKRFGLTVGLLFDTCVITVSYMLCRCDFSALDFKSFYH